MVRPLSLLPTHKQARSSVSMEARKVMNSSTSASSMVVISAPIAFVVMVHTEPAQNSSSRAQRGSVWGPHMAYVWLVDACTDRQTGLPTMQDLQLLHIA